MADTLSASLDLLVAQVTTWLTPTIDADCRRQDAAKLRVFLANLMAARDHARLIEEGLADGGAPLSVSLEGLANAFAAMPDGTVIGRSSLNVFVATLTEAASSAWALELALRIRARAVIEDEIDIETLALARKLVVGGVVRGSRLAARPAPSAAPEGGDAA